MTHPIPEVKTRQTVTLRVNLKKFMPDLDWVLKARSTGVNREALKYLSIDENGFCCTDGKRLHLAGLYANKEFLPKGLDHGLYEVNVLKDVVVFIPKEGRFPNYKAVIFQSDVEPTIINLDFTKWDNDKSMRYSASLVRIAKALDYKSTINIDFIKDLSGYCWKMQGKDTVAKFVCGSNTALVLGLRIDRQ